MVEYVDLPAGVISGQRDVSIKTLAAPAMTARRDRARTDGVRLTRDRDQPTSYAAVEQLRVERRAALRRYVFLDAALAMLWERHGSDLLITTGREPLARIDGDLRAVPGYEPMTNAQTVEAARALLDDEQWAAFKAGAEIDFSFSWRGGARIRGNAFHQRSSVAIALRMIPAEIPSFDDLGLPPAVRALGQLQSGSRVRHRAYRLGQVDDARLDHRLDQPEPSVSHPHDRGPDRVPPRSWHGSGQPARGRHRHPLVRHALRSALRENPDVILVGEMRDLESIHFALTLAETGHLVLATLHTNDTSQAVDRLIDVFPADQQPQVRVQLANSITAVVYQRLVPQVTRGVAAAFEVLMATSPVRNLIKEGKTNQLRNQLVTGQRDGSQTLEQSLNDLVKAGIISYDSAYACSTHPNEIIRE